MAANKHASEKKRGKWKQSMTQTNLKMIGLTWSNQIKNSSGPDLRSAYKLHANTGATTRMYVHSSINMQGYSIMHESPHH